jgi:hypothetical protein
MVESRKMARKRKLLKIILPIAFLLLIIMLILFNKSTVRQLVPIDYITDPWPTQTQESCGLPDTPPTQ